MRYEHISRPDPMTDGIKFRPDNPEDVFKLGQLAQLADKKKGSVQWAGDELRYVYLSMDEVLRLAIS